jgi:hypothetical protein
LKHISVLPDSAAHAPTSFPPYRGSGGKGRLDSFLLQGDFWVHGKTPKWVAGGVFRVLHRGIKNLSVRLLLFYQNAFSKSASKSLLSDYF